MTAPSMTATRSDLTRRSEDGGLLLSIELPRPSGLSGIPTLFASTRGSLARMTLRDPSSGATIVLPDHDLEAVRWLTAVPPFTPGDDQIAGDLRRPGECYILVCELIEGAFAGGYAAKIRRIRP